MALTIAGADFNIPEFVILSNWPAKGVLATFGAYVFAVALICGALAQLMVT